MKPLPQPLRRQLESAVVEARRVAERAARASLERLAVERPEPFAHSSPDERQLRVRLRARARQLGDRRLARPDEQGRNHTLDHLAQEAAYELWHRMLFARFLAESGLLVHPSGVAVSLDECDELAAEEGAANGWALAARYASAMLPQIFRHGDPVLEVALAPEDQVALERLLAGLPAEVFSADDSLGWVYQFWQTERKAEVNRSEAKIGADELPAVTQLFTEHYMVEFLLHNTLGAWWAGKVLGEEVRGLSSEAELRARVALPGVGWDYLRFVEEGGAWRPAAGTFPGWPRAARDLRVLDPCCGSGHFLVAELELLVPMRMAEEGLSAAAAVDAVLRDNLFALELDPRCTQLAAFALAFAAWRYPGAGGHRPLPALNVACCGLAPRARKEEWLALAGRDEKLRAGMERLHDLFQDAPELGSLVDPGRVAEETPLYVAPFAELAPLLEQALAAQETTNAEREATGVAARGIAHAAALLAGTYTLVATNVPYLARSKQGEVLRKFCDAHHSLAKHDLATVFLERCIAFTVPGRTSAIVVPRSFMMLSRYARLRQGLLATTTLHFVCLLGGGAFQAISGEVVDVALLGFSSSPASEIQLVAFVDTASAGTPSAKASEVTAQPVRVSAQRLQQQNPDSRILPGEPLPHSPLSLKAHSRYGLRTADAERFIARYWEVTGRRAGWRFHQSTVKYTVDFGGREQILRWEAGTGALSELAELGLASIQGQDAWGKTGVAVSLMGDLPVTRYTGETFDNNCAVVWPTHSDDLAAVFAFCASAEFSSAVRRLDSTLKVTSGTLLKVPFDHHKWKAAATATFPHGLPKPYSDDPTQWLFHGHPRPSTAPLQVAVARLLGYRWPAESDEAMDLADEARAWVARARELDRFADDDGVVCLPAVGGERPAADRLRDLLGAANGSDWSPAREQELLAGVGFAGRGLEEWLRDGFFEQHCKLFHQRPFVWQVWDGRRDGFSALVHYHRLDRRLLERLTYSYLNDWVARQQHEAARGEAVAEARLLAARDLQKRLALILEGEAPHDVFVRWKPLDRQPVGWDPDLDDGVRLNIRPFVAANVLRKRPGIKWDKDRGKDPESAPWYPVFNGVRVNDHHLSLADKRAAREQTR